MSQIRIDVFTKEDKEAFKDPVFYKEFRHELESELNVNYISCHVLFSILHCLLQAVHLATIRGSEMQKGARQAFQENMRKRLAKKPWIADHCASLN